MALPRSKKRRHNVNAGENSLVKPTLSYVLNIYPICNHLCSVLPIADLIRLTRTCKQFSSLYQRAIPAQWNINKRLRRFVQDPQEFRNQMAAEDALISGSFAVQFSERVNWNESDLDIFVEYLSSDYNEFEEYLCKREGYRFIREQDHNSEVYVNMSTLVKVWTAGGLADKHQN